MQICSYLYIFYRRYYTKIISVRWCKYFKISVQQMLSPHICQDATPGVSAATAASTIIHNTASPEPCHSWFAQFAHVTPRQPEWDVKCLKNQTQSFFKPACQILCCWMPLYIQMWFDFLTTHIHSRPPNLTRCNTPAAALIRASHHQGEATAINLSRSFHFRVNYTRRHIHDHLLRVIFILYPGSLYTTSSFYSADITRLAVWIPMFVSKVYRGIIRAGYCNNTSYHSLIDIIKLIISYKCVSSINNWFY